MPLTLAPSTLRIPISFAALLGHKSGQGKQAQAGNDDGQYGKRGENMAYALYIGIHIGKTFVHKAG